MSSPFTVLCIACYFKGTPFLQQCKSRGCKVLLVTSEKLRNEDWPRDSVDEFLYMPDENGTWNRDHLLDGISHVARSHRIDRIVPLDDYDLERAAMLREHLRVPGMGETRTRYFRDKLAMRRQAEEAGIAVPPYAAAINDQEILAYTQSVDAPWLLKPRMQASATGIVKVSSVDEVFSALNAMGDDRSHYLIEKFVPGDIYHVDSIVYREKVIFARVSGYAETPMKVAHEGGIFVTHTIDHQSVEGRRLLEENERLMGAMGHRSGVAHTEFIMGKDGQLYFLETAARVGGAHIAEMVEAASGVNLWREWAHIETLRPGEEYGLPEVRKHHAGLVVSLARQEYPDLSSFDYPEVVWRLHKRHHAGLIVASDKLSRVKHLVSETAARFQSEFMAVAPLPDRPSA